MTDHAERIAVLEERHRSMKEELESMDTKLDTIQSNIERMQSSLSRQKGFWAGVTFMASIIGFGLSQIWQFFHKPT